MIITKGMELQLNKLWAKILYFTLVIAFCFGSTLYFYFTLRNVEPYGEDLISVGLQWATNNFHTRAKIIDLWEMFCFFVAGKYGYSYLSLRIVEGIFWFAISFFAFDLAIRRRGWNIRLYAIPIFILFLVLIPEKTSFFFGQCDEEVQMYPLVEHMMPMLYSTFLVWIYSRCQSIKEGIYRKIANYLIIFLAFFLIIQSNILTGLMFLIPLILILGRKRIKSLHDFVILFVALLGFGAVVKIGAHYFDILRLFFNEDTDQYSIFYGAGNFFDFNEFGQNISAAFGCFLAEFGIDISGHSFLDIRNLSKLFRFGLLAFALVYMMKNVISFFKDGIENDSEEILISLAVVMNFLIFLFGSYGDRNNTRYFNVSLIFLTVFLCWKSAILFERINNNYCSPRLMWILLFGTCLIIDFNFEIFKIKNTTVFQDNYDRIISVVDEKNLHQGIAGHVLAATITARSQGECIVGAAKYDEKECKLQFYDGVIDQTNCYFDYILFQTDKPWYSVRCDEQDIFKLYGIPDETIEMYKCKMFIYRKGIDL